MNETCHKLRKVEIMDKFAMDRAITRMTYQIIEKNRGVGDVVLIGIYRRGCEIAERIRQKIKKLEYKDINMGVIDIANYRDDKRPSQDHKDMTKIDFSYNNKSIVLVDDVMFTGRSVCAAIEGIMNRERPKNIQLAVLIDRGHREVPIRPDYVGKNVPTSQNEAIEVEVFERDGFDRVFILDVSNDIS